MLTVLIFGARDPADLALTLSPLVSGAVEGVLRDVVVLDAADEDLRRVADHAGCRLMDTAELAARAATLRGEWILLLRAGDRLPDDWIDRAVRHAGGKGEGRAVRLPDPDAGLMDHVLSRGRGAILLPRGVLAAAMPAAGGNIEVLARRLRPRRMRAGR